MLRTSAVVLAAVVLASCGNSLRNKEKVQQAIVNRLQTRSGLDLKALDITTTNVSFDKNMAYATVAFHPKNNPSVDSGMTMKYTLEARDGKWVVVKVGDSRGYGGGAPVPPGHPPITANPHDARQEQGASGQPQ